MTENYIETEHLWAQAPTEYIDAGEVTITPWDSDSDIAVQADELSGVYGDQYEIDTLLRLFRSQLRAAAMAHADAENSAVLIRSVLDLGAAELVTASSTDTELNAIAIAAEAGHGAPIVGLRDELALLRDAEREEAAADA